MWQPTRVKRFIECYGTSTQVMRVDTDAGEGFLKAMGNPEGPHVLACELVGTMLAEWLGLRTLEYAVVEVAAEDELPFRKGGQAVPGPAFITKAVEGFPWGRGEFELGRLRRVEDVTRLVVLDTWIRNCDRHRPEPNPRQNPDNVFLRRMDGTQGEMELVAMDHTHAFTCGRPLTARLGQIDAVKDEVVYGCFPEFVGLLDRGAGDDSAGRLKQMTPGEARALVAKVPEAWEVGAEVREAWACGIAARAEYVAESLVGRLWPTG